MVMAQLAKPRVASGTFVSPDGKSNLKLLDKLCCGGVIERFTKAKLDEEYAARLAQERLFWVTHEGALNRLLIVWDCLYWARRESIHITTVHGALDSSLTAYLLEIIPLDPLRRKLEFDEVALEQTGPITITVASVSELNLLKTFINNRYTVAFRPFVEVGSPPSCP